MYEIKVRTGSYLYPLVINKERKTLSLSFRYNAVSGRWLMDVGDGNGKKLLSSIPLIPSQNILEQYSYMKIGQAWVVPNNPDEFLKVPSETSFEENWKLLWGDTI